MKKIGLAAEGPPTPQMMDMGDRFTAFFPVVQKNVMEMAPKLSSSGSIDHLADYFFRRGLQMLDPHESLIEDNSNRPKGDKTYAQFP